MACKHLKIKVTGKVQGVWFRKYTKDQAQALNIKGFVRNEPDGSVYIEAESAQEKQIHKFLQWLHQGAPLSKVNNVAIIAESTCQNFKDFVIQR